MSCIDRRYTINPIAAEPRLRIKKCKCIPALIVAGLGLMVSACTVTYSPNYPTGASPDWYRSRYSDAETQLTPRYVGGLEVDAFTLTDPYLDFRLGDKLDVHAFPASLLQQLVATLQNQAVFEFTTVTGAALTKLGPGQQTGGHLGVFAVPVTPELAKRLGVGARTGAVIASVGHDSPAERAGLKRWDVITEFNGQPTRSPEGLNSAVLATSPGSNVSAKIVRATRPLTLQLQTGSTPLDPTKVFPPQYRLTGELGGFGFDWDPSHKVTTVSASITVKLIDLRDSSLVWSRTIGKQGSDPNTGSVLNLDAAKLPVDAVRTALSDEIVTQLLTSPQVAAAVEKFEPPEVSVAVASTSPGMPTIAASPAIPPSQRELVAVLELDGVNASKSELAALTEELRAKLLQSGKFRVVDRQQIDTLLKEQAFQQTGCTSQECAVQVGKILGVRKMVVGRVTKIEDELWQLSAQMVDAESAETVRAVTYKHEGKFSTLMDQGMSVLVAELTGNG